MFRSVITSRLTTDQSKMLYFFDMMLQKIFIYFLFFFLFAIPNYGIVYITTAWAMCPCIENVISGLFLRYGAIIFGLLAVAVALIINKKRSLVFSLMISWIICFCALSASRIILTTNAQTVGKIFPSLVPKRGNIPLPRIQ